MTLALRLLCNNGNRWIPRMRLIPRAAAACLRSHCRVFVASLVLPIATQKSNCTERTRWQYVQQRLFSVADGSGSFPAEEEYSRKTQVEHVLLRPGMYVGPNERMPPQPHWILESAPPTPSKELATMSLADMEFPTKCWDGRVAKRQCEIVPALLKIFDEILVNASDNRLRHPETCTRIDVVVDPGSEDRDPIIRVYNDGNGIPIRMHNTEKIYIPELLFGHLLTGSNFDDTNKRLTGGRHGYGAKLTNIFSKSFTVEVADSSAKNIYTQTWTENMSNAAPCRISPYQDGQDYTCISFVPDLERLTGVQGASIIEADDYAMICRRVLDIAGCAAGALRVSLNGWDVSVPSFETYVTLYPTTEKLVFQSISNRWSIGVGLSPESEFESISFVNGVSTNRGGTHVDAITNQITNKLKSAITEKDDDLLHYVSTKLVKKHLFVAVNSLIENPTFDSQMKEKLTTRAANMGSSCTLPAGFFSKLVEKESAGGPGIVEAITKAAKRKQKDNLKKALGMKQKSQNPKFSIAKLEEAHLAGTRDGWKCTIILTEGDSAKALAIAGLEVIGRQNFGVFPLRGKFLNVRHATQNQLATNAEVKALCSIIGLDFDKDYRSVKERRSLRYGRVMLMADQDQDGSHIKGLVINFFKTFWPYLLRPPIDGAGTNDNTSFLSVFCTPLLKVWKGKNKKLSFYSESEYDKWKESVGNDFSNYDIKYYKGLGTSTPAEAKEYFSAFDRHVRMFEWQSEEDDDLLDMAFEKTRVADRRVWINGTYDEKSGIYSDQDITSSITYADFVNKELVHFSHDDNIRSIPSAIDGLKPSQRKVLYACFKRNLKSEMKVAQLSGYCAEHTAYHHGEASLHSTIVGMAQDFQGSNNINLLEPRGMFGTRLEGGEDAASPRYIFTCLSPITRILFPEDDDQLLTYLEDDGQTIEPQFYCPIIPMLLVNGSVGIGTGWSTYIPQHNPFDIVNVLRGMLDDQAELPEISPYARGFTGTIEKGARGYTSVGRVTKNGGQLHIEELPIGCWTNKYKKQLLGLRDKGVISKFLENHTTTKVSFFLDLALDQFDAMDHRDIAKKLKLTSNLGTTNMHAFDAQGNLVKFDNPQSIVEAFFPVRLGLYTDRLSVQKSDAEYRALFFRNQARFIEMVVGRSINLIDTSTSTLNTRLLELGFDSASRLEEVRNSNAIGNRKEKKIGKGEQDPFKYLLELPVRSFTSERIAKLKKDAMEKDRELERTRAMTSHDLWRQDLDELVRYLSKEPIY